MEPVSRYTTPSCNNSIVTTPRANAVLCSFAETGCNPRFNVSACCQCTVTLGTSVLRESLLSGYRYACGLAGPPALLCQSHSTSNTSAVSLRSCVTADWNTYVEGDTVRHSRFARSTAVWKEQVVCALRCAQWSNLLYVLSKMGALTYHADGHKYAPTDSSNLQ
jgi:hypothetical protein